MADSFVRARRAHHTEFYGWIATACGLAMTSLRAKRGNPELILTVP